MNMREKIARALCRNRARGYCEQTPMLETSVFSAWWDENRHEIRDRCFEEVDIMLDALMEPTEEMIEAGEEVSDKESMTGRYMSRPHRDAFRRERFIQMIRAAKEGK